MGQVFFSFGLGMGVMITYGSYLDGGEDIHRSTVYVAVADTGVALLAGAVVIPALFAFGLPIQGGAGLLFVALPGVLNQMPLGTLLNVVFFVMLAIAALTSAISLLEALVALARQRLGRSRGITTLGAAVLVFVANIPSALAQGPYGIHVLGRDFLTAVDVVASDVLLPLAGLLTAEAFWKPGPSAVPPGSALRAPALLVPMAALAAFTFALGLAAEPIFALSTRAAEQLLDPSRYVEAVLR